MEVVGEYKYLGTIIDNRLRWDRHSSATYNKCQQRLYCLRKLRFFNTDNTILSMFYKWFTQSVLTFSFISWFGNVRQKDKNNLQRIVNISSKVTGTKQLSLFYMKSRSCGNPLAFWLTTRICCILADNTHMLHEEYRLTICICCMRNTSLCRRRDGLQLLHAKQTENGYYLFLCLFDC